MTAFNTQEGFQLTYPSDLSKEHFFPEAIRFGFFERLGVDFEQIQGQMKDKWDASKRTKGSTAQADEWLKNRIRQDKADRIGILKMQANSLSGTNGTEQIKNQVARMEQDYFNEFKVKLDQHQRESVIQLLANAGTIIGDAFKQIQTQNTLQKAIGSVYLHMPNNITLTEEAGWGGESLGVVGALTKKALKSGEGDVTSKLLGAGVGSAGNVLAAAGGGIVGSVLGKMGIAMGGLLGMVTGGAIQKGGEAAFSVSHNPYMEMMFSGIGFRSFKFDFVFRARNKSEINMVGRIIQMFRQHSRPSWQGGALGKAFMKYPQEYKIQFLTNTNGDYIDNLHLPQLKSCVCSNVETNFTPDNMRKIGMITADRNST